MKVGIYVRISTEEQHLTTQVDALQSRFASNDIVDVYTDIASGKDMNRPEWMRLIDDVRRGNVNVIAVTKIDRIARSLSAFVSLTRELQSYNVSIYSMDLGMIDYSDPMSRMLVNILSVFAEFERDLIRDRTKAALAQRKKEGKKLGRPSMGLEYHKAALMRLDGKSWSTIANELNYPRGTVQSQRFRRTVEEESNKILAERCADEIATVKGAIHND